MTIPLQLPSTNWPANYNNNLTHLDDILTSDLDDINVTKPVYQSSVLQWDSATSMWVNSGILTSVQSSVYGVWDATCKDVGSILHRDGRVMYNNNANYPTTRADLGSDTVWKYYVEFLNLDCDIRCNSMYCRVGFGYVTDCLDPKANNSFWYYRGDGYLYDDGDVYKTADPDGFAQGAVIGMAVEVVGTTCKVWMTDAVSGDWLSGDPVTGISPSFEINTSGYEIFPMGYAASLGYLELVTNEEYMKYSVPSGFYPLRTNNFSTTTTSTTTTTVTFSTTTTTT